MRNTGLRGLLFTLLAAALFVACDDNGLPGEVEPVASVEVEAPAQELLVGSTLQLTAVAQSRTGEPLPGRPIEWRSSDSMIAQVSTSGLVTARSAGAATIRASSEGREGSVALSVRALPVPVAAVRIGPQTDVDLRPGMTFQFTATVVAANDSVLTDRPVTWETSNSEVASVSATGLVTAHTVGTARIAASSGGRGAVATVTVSQTVARLELAHDGVISLYTGDTYQLGVRAFAADGTELFGRTVSWTVVDASIAAVSSTGLVRGIAYGSTDVTANVEGQTAMVAIDVRSRIARIDMQPALVVLGPGEEVSVNATARAADGSILQRPLTWASSDPTVATVDGSGRIVALKAGVTAITATAEGQQGYTSVTVVPWAVRPLEMIGDSLPPATLFTRTSIDSAGAVRNTRVVATSGSFRMVIAGVNSGRYELNFNVWIIVNGQGFGTGQYGYRGDFHYDSAAGVLVLRSYNGETLTARLLADGRAVITGRLEPDTPVLTLTYRTQ